MTLVHPEVMSDGFSKWHLRDGLVLHRFTAPDDGEPHDHPWAFTTQILSGGYVEEVYSLMPEGGWTMSLHYRWPGETHRVEAQTIHRIVSLPEGECWTLIRPEAWEQQPGFWRLRHGVAERRVWNEGWA